MTAPLSAGLVEALHGVAGVPRLLVALDFDGTLAPHVDVPDDARPLPEAREAVAGLLGLPGVVVAFVSGRAMDSLLRVAEPPPEILLVGSHGIEYRLGGEESARAGLVLDAVDRARRAALQRVLADIVEPNDGAWIEEKPAGFVLHTRHVADEEARALERTARAAAASVVGGLTVRPGKHVLEFSLRPAGKGQAVARLRRHADADAVLYVGDDVTDEEAFAALGDGDIGIKVGEGPTRAPFSVAGPAEVATALRELAALRG